MLHNRIKRLIENNDKKNTFIKMRNLMVKKSKSANITNIKKMIYYNSFILFINLLKINVIHMNRIKILQKRYIMNKIYINYKQNNTNEIKRKLFDILKSFYIFNKDLKLYLREAESIQN